MAKCKTCGSDSHYTTFCYQTKKKAIAKVSRKMHSSKAMTYLTWLRKNPPDEAGYWKCYLQINKKCFRRVNAETINFEHIYPKSKYKELKYIHQNIGPACAPCNQLKGSRTIYQLAIVYPQIRRLINTPEWKTKMAYLEDLSRRRRKRNHHLTDELMAEV